MRTGDCRETCAAFSLMDDAPGAPCARRHEMLYATYRNTCSRAREDLCQMLASDIRDARRLGATALADDLAVVLGLVVDDCPEASAATPSMATVRSAASRAA